MPQAWVETTEQRNQLHRIEGKYAVGKALWAPKYDENGRKNASWTLLPQIAVGDIILHLVDGKFTGISIVDQTARDFRCLEGTRWSKYKDCYLVTLKNYQAFAQPLDPRILFQPPYRERAQQIVESESRLFYTKALTMQEAYLTRLPPPLIRLILDAYHLNLPVLAQIGGQEVTRAVDPNRGEYEADPTSIIREAAGRMQAAGYVMEVRDLASILIALTVRPFAIFSGRSGTGKTALTRLLAEVFGFYYLNVAVNPAWTDPTDLVGYISPTTHQPVQGALHDLLIRHVDDAILCLDEFNTAKVEHYFSDFMSAMETRQREFWGPLPALDQLARAQPSQEDRLQLPRRLRVIGTMNFDDSVQSLTPRLLDRATVFEFQPVTPEQILLSDHPERYGLAWDSLKDQPSLRWPFDGIPPLPDTVRAWFLDQLRQLEPGLRASRGELSPRLVVEFGSALALGNGVHDLFGATPEAAWMALLDQLLLTRVLPKFQGASRQGDLRALVRLAGVLTGSTPPEEPERWVAFLHDQGPSSHYPRTLAKIATLLTSAEEDGYAVYWQ